MTKSREYQPRIYRESMGNSRWKSFVAGYLETDLWVSITAEQFNNRIPGFVHSRITEYRALVDNHISSYPEFRTSMVPLPVPNSLHPLLNDMYVASRAAGTGPMSAVAGAFAEYICRDLSERFRVPETVIENGGDIYMMLKEKAIVSVYAGQSPLSGKLGIVIEPGDTPVSVCCSSATVGHSLSWGAADACMVACTSGALADAYATAGCNMVKNSEMVKEVTGKMIARPGVLSAVIIKDDKSGIGGKFEITVLPSVTPPEG